MRLKAAFATVAALTIAATIAACGESDEPAGLPSPDATTSASADPAETPAEAMSEPGEATSEPTQSTDEADLEALYLEYWDVVADLYSDPRIEVEPALDVATAARAERMMGYISSELIANDARRVGKPEFSDITVTVDGDEAVIEACMDQSDWKLEAGGDEVALDLSEVRPAVALAVKHDDRWLIHEISGPEEASLNC